MIRFKPVIRSVEWHLGWQDLVGDQVSFQIWYHLREGPKQRLEAQIIWSSLSDLTRRRLSNLVSWALRQFPTPDARELLGQRIQPRLGLDTLHFTVFGETEVEPNTLRASTWIHHRKDVKDPGPQLVWMENELPPEIHALARSYDQEAWTAVREDIVAGFEELKELIPIAAPPSVYVAYLDADDRSKSSARKLAQYLWDEKEMRAFYAPWEIGWSQVLFNRLREEMVSCDATVLCWTDEFRTGKTAEEEYQFFKGKIEENASFPAGLLLVGADPELLEAVMKDRVFASIEGPDDTDFFNAAEEIYRGILGLGQELR